MKLIDADKVIEHLDLCLKESDNFTPIVDATLTAIKCYIEDAPTVDAIDRQQFICWLNTAKFHDISDGRGLRLVMFKDEFEDLIKSFK